MILFLQHTYNTRAPAASTSLFKKRYRPTSPKKPGRQRTPHLLHRPRRWQTHRQHGRPPSPRPPCPRPRPAQRPRPMRWRRSGKLSSEQRPRRISMPGAWQKRLRLTSAAVPCCVNMRLRQSNRSTVRCSVYRPPTRSCGRRCHQHCGSCWTTTAGARPRSCPRGGGRGSYRKL